MNKSQEVEDFLAHYGKKGMHWGQRKAKQNPEVKVQVTTTVNPKKNGKAKFARNMAAAVVVGGVLGYAGGKLARNLISAPKHREIDAFVKSALKRDKIAEGSAKRLGNMMSPENVKRLTRDGGVLNFPSRPPKAMYDSTAKLMGYR